MNPLEEYIRSARILIIDDELANVRLIEGCLEDNNQPNFRSTTDSRRAADLFKDFQPDLVLLDLSMPYLDGFAVMGQLQQLISPDQNVPIVVLTADIMPTTRNRALGAGARDFLTKPFDEAELRLRTRNLLELRFLHLGLQKQNRELETRVQERTAQLETTLAELKSAQAQSVLQERYHAFGQMAGGVVHDFNNTLTILLGFSEMLLGEGALRDEEETRNCLRSMNTAARDAATIVSRLRHFYRPRHEDDRLAMVSLRELLQQASLLSRPRWREQARAEGRFINLELDLQDGRDLLCNASEIREAIINLVFNAVDAMPAGGTITLRAREEGDSAIIEVSDTGVGMSPEVAQRCLEPFFSTKGEKGTGLGLAVVYGIVKRHEGALSIESETGIGTTFKISIPLKAAPAALRRAAQAGVRPLRILFADNEAEIRKVISLQLSNAGHDVATAEDGLDAMAQMAKEHFDVLLTDLSMPKMDGAKLAAAARKFSNPPAVIMLTGFGSMLLPGGNKPDTVDMMLSKPVTAQALLDALGSVTAHTN